MEPRFIKHYVISGIFIGLLTAGTFIGNLLLNGWQFGEYLDPESNLYEKSTTLAFVVLTLTQMVHAFNSRSNILSVFQMKFFSNVSLLAAVSFSIVATIVLVQIPFFGKYLHIVPLNGKEWLTLAGLALLVLFFEEFGKMFRRRKMRQV